MDLFMGKRENLIVHIRIISENNEINNIT